MFSELIHYQGKDTFLIEFLQWHFSKYWKVQSRQVFAQIVTYFDTHKVYPQFHTQKETVFQQHN